MSKYSSMALPLAALLTTLLLLIPSCSEMELGRPGDESGSGDIPSWQRLIVTGDVVNLRAGPGTEYATLGQVECGDTLQITGDLGDWYRVYIRSQSLFAWIYGPLTSGGELPR